MFISVFDKLLTVVVMSDDLPEAVDLNVPDS